MIRKWELVFVLNPIPILFLTEKMYLSLLQGQIE